MRALLVAILGITALFGATGHTQDAPTQALSFDVASVKRTTAPVQERNGIIPTPGRFTAEKVMAATLIGFAYRGAIDEIRGEPDWSHSEFYDVVAPLPAGITPEQTSLMVRALLTERFGLIAHIEAEERDVLALARVQPDGPLPGAFARVDVDCDALSAAGQLPAPVARTETMPPCRGAFDGREYRSGGLPLRMLIANIRGAVGRAVIDETGLAGYYRWTLRYAPDRPGFPPPTDDYPDITTALREQLGLKLVPKKARVNVLVVDRLAHPSAN